MKSKASGIVKKLLVDAGDRVKKGQLLAQLDKDEIEAQVEQSRAAMEAADASLTRAPKPTTSAPRSMPKGRMFRF